MPSTLRLHVSRNLGGRAADGPLRGRLGRSRGRGEHEGSAQDTESKSPQWHENPSFRSKRTPEECNRFTGSTPTTGFLDGHRDRIRGCDVRDRASGPGRRGTFVGVRAGTDAHGPCRQRLELHFGPAEDSRRRRAGKEARKKGRRRRNVLGLGRFRSTHQRAYRRAVYGGRLGLASERPRARRPGRVAGGTPGAGRRGGAQGNVVRRHGSEASATRPGAKGPHRRIRFRGAARALTTGAGARVRAGGVLSASV